MTGTKTWRDVLEALPEEKRPRRRLETNCTLGIVERGGMDRWAWVSNKDPNAWVVIDDDYAHLAIRCAAEDFVREWCKERSEYMVIDPEPPIEIGCSAPIHDDSRLGRGPDLPTALHAAVTHCKGSPT